jgi:hypothetical protein
MATLDGIRQQILVRSFWARIAGLDPAKARQLAIKEIAAEHCAQRKLNAASVTPRRPGQHDDPRRTLIDRVMAMLDRLRAAPPKRVRLDAAPATSPAPPPRKPLVERIADLVTPEPEPLPGPPSTAPTIVSPGSGAVLIPESEFAPGLRSVVTESWRNSVQQNVVSLEAKRGGPKRSWYIG